MLEDVHNRSCKVSASAVVGFSLEQWLALHRGTVSCLWHRGAMLCPTVHLLCLNGRQTPSLWKGYSQQQALVGAELLPAVFSHPSTELQQKLKMFACFYLAFPSHLLQENTFKSTRA